MSTRTQNYDGMSRLVDYVLQEASRHEHLVDYEAPEATVKRVARGDHLQVFREKGVMSKTGKISPDAFVAEQDYVSEREYETAEEFLDMVLEMPTRKNAIEQKYDELEADFWESVEADGIKLDDASAIINAEIDLLYAMLGKSPVRAKLLSREIDKREELSEDDVRELKKLAADLERTAREAFDQGVTEQKGAQREAEAELKGKQKG